MEIFCLTQLRNEERFLPGFLHHIVPYVDGIVALDDGSTDGTVDILRAEPKVVSILRERRRGLPHANEVSNRHRMILEAARLNASWVVCADADERFETRFLRRIHREAEKGDRLGQPVRMIKIVNLWDSPDQYRLDGRNGPRWTARFFRLPATITRRPPRMHQPWFPPELDAAPRGYAPSFLYHLRMIDRADREARFEKFTAADPDLSHQPVGYGHITDEAGLTLKPVLPFRGFVDLPRTPASPPAPPRQTASEFARRFHIDERWNGAAGAPSTPPRERSLLHGFDFDAIFDDLRTRQG